MGLLTAALLFAAPGEAHGTTSSTPYFFTTDNLVRWGLSHGLNVSAERDDNCGPNVENCADLWVLPVNTEGSTLQQTNPDVELTINTRHEQFGSITDGYTTASASCCLFAGMNVTQGVGNASVFNLTWAADVPATHVDYLMSIANTDTGAGTITIWFELRASTGAVLQSFSNTVPCNTGASLARSDIRIIPRTLFRTFNVAVDTTGCTLAGAEQLNFLWNRLSITSRDNQADAETYISPALEYADFLMGRNSVVNGNGAGGDTNITNLARSIVVPQGTSYLYTMGSCDLGGCGLGQGLTWPGGWTSATPAGATCASLNLTWMGPSLNGASSTRHIETWRVINPCAASSTLRIGGLMLAHEATTPILVSNATQGNIYANAYDKGTGPLDDSTRPTAAYCNACIDGMSGTNDDVIAIAVKDRSWGPLRTYPSSLAFNVDANFDITNATSSASGVNSNGVRNITVTITGDELQFGNAYYIGWLAYNTTATPGTCPSQVKVNGLPVDTRVVATRGPATGGDAGLGFGLFCFALVEDFQRTYSLTRSGGGEILYQSNTFPSASYTVNVDFPATARAPNGPAGAGYELRQIQRIDGRFAERVQCSTGTFVCYGNLNTEGESFGGDPINATWDFQIWDASNGTQGFHVAIANASIIEEVNDNFTLSNETGRATMETIGDTLRFNFRKDGFRTEYANFTHVPDGTRFNFTVEMTRDFTLIATLDCFNTPQGITCELLQGDPEGGPRCDEFNVQQGECEQGAAQGAAKDIRFNCGLDRTTNRFLTDRNVSYVSEAQGYAISVSGLANRTAAQEFCEATRTDPFTSGVQRLFPGSTLDITINAPGYQGVQWSAAWLNANTTVLYPAAMLPGSTTWPFASTCHTDRNTGPPQGPFTPPAGCRVIVEVINETRAEFGGARNYSIIQFSWVEGDTGIGGQLPPLGQQVALLGVALNVEPGLWGLLIFVVIWFGILGGWFEFIPKDIRDRGPDLLPIIAGAALVSFGAVTFMGLWPSWVVIAFIMFLGAIVALVVYRAASSSRGGQA